MHQRGRWLARARFFEGRWRAEAPEPVPPLDRFVDELLAPGPPLLAGFDFPIGLPERIGAATGRPDFPAALETLPASFYTIASSAEEIGPARPFYPARSGGTSRAQLLSGHGVAHLDALLRRCEVRAPGRRSAGCMFWTLGASQVGRAALVGWQHVIQPARSRGAALWPFDGVLHTLANEERPVLAETYPADGYARLDAAFRPRESKRRRADRAGKASALLAWAHRNAVTLAPALSAAITDGFGDADRGGDSFDAVIGLLAMIDVLRQGPIEPPDDPVLRRWEGWILGRGA